MLTRTYHHDAVAPFAPEPMDLKGRQVRKLGREHVEKLGLACVRFESVLQLKAG